MDAKGYEKATRFWREWKYGQSVLTWADRLITLFTLIAYPVLLVYLCFNNPKSLYSCMLVPAVSFAVVSVYRSLCNAGRPYEELDIRPLLKKDTKGRSFPSRHVFSIFMVGMAYWQICPQVGVLLWVLGALLGAVRVLGGVHYLRDVAAGAAVALLSGWLGFYLIF